MTRVGRPASADVGTSPIAATRFGAAGAGRANCPLCIWFCRRAETVEHHVDMTSDRSSIAGPAPR